MFTIETHYEIDQTNGVLEDGDELIDLIEG
jgi:hypothetical protein